MAIRKCHLHLDRLSQPSTKTHNFNQTINFVVQHLPFYLLFTQLAFWTFFLNEPAWTAKTQKKQLAFNAINLTIPSEQNQTYIDEVTMDDWKLQ